MVAFIRLIRGIVVADSYRCRIDVIGACLSVKVKIDKIIMLVLLHSHDANMQGYWFSGRCIHGGDMTI